jgi:hypothetical protein
MESSVIGLRSAVFTLARPATPLRFVVFPMVHVAEPDFYHQVADRAGECDLIVAEGAPARCTPAQGWMARIRWDHLVDQVAGLDLEALGVPVQWEYAEHDRLRSGREQAVAKVVDSAAAVALRALGRYGSPLGLPGLDQSDEHDDRWERLDSLLGRIMENRVLHGRDSRLGQALGAIHRERCGEPIKIAVVYGAAHIPAVVDFLSEDYRYRPGNARWLTVARAPD